MSLAALAKPDIDGKWSYTQTDNQKIGEKHEGDAQIKVTVNYTFDGSYFECSMKAILTMSFDQKGDDGKAEKAEFVVIITASTTGSSAFDGDLLTLTPDKKKPRVDVDATINGSPAGSMISGMVAAPVKKTLVAELKQIQKYKIVSVTDSKLTLQSVPTEKEKVKGVKEEIITLSKR